MITLFKRRSVVIFIAVCLIGCFGPIVIGSDPSDVTGAPFAYPIWWNTELPANAKIEAGESGAAFEWTSPPPAVFTLTGKICADPGKEVRVMWHTPGKNFVLASLTGQSVYWLNMDGRDMIFKQQLGLPPIGESVNSLFPSAGKYRLTVEGASYSRLKLNLPGKRHGLLGTDQRGRDVFTMLIYGIRTSLVIGISATIIASLLGLGFGIAAGYAGGLPDAVIMRSVDILLSIPTLPVLMVFAGIWGKGLWQLVLILSIFSWMGTARSVRSLVLTVRESAWVEGLKALGAKRSYIMRRHLIPEAAPILFANIALGVPGVILSEAALAFLGLSDPRLISWGRMLHEAHTFGAFTEGAWWLLLPPGLAIVTICLIFMDIGRYLEERIDPRLGGRRNARSS